MDVGTVRVARDRGRVLLVLAAVVAVAAPWLLVARKLGDAHPAPSTLRATSLVWAGRVFTSPEQFERWLHSRGASYTAWQRTHPQLTFGTAAERAAAARRDSKAHTAGAKTTKRHVAAPMPTGKPAPVSKVKHRPAAHVATPVSSAGKPAAPSKTKRQAAPAPATSGAAHSASAVTASQNPAPASGGALRAAGATAGPPRTGHGLEVALLLFGCFVVLAGVGLPAAFRLVQPYRWTIPFEARLLVVATGVSLALAGVIAGGFV